MENQTKSDWSLTSWSFPSWSFPSWSLTSWSYFSNPVSDGQEISVDSNKKGKNVVQKCNPMYENQESFCKERMKSNHKSRRKTEEDEDEEYLPNKKANKSNLQKIQQHQEIPISNKEGYMYLIQFRDQNGGIVYKIGKTKDLFRRIKEYTFPRLLECSLVENMDECERCLILKVRELFKIAKGNEFFYCRDEIEIHTLRTFFCSFINHYK